MANNKIFDPVPSQIVGNIRCISDPDQLASGYFEIARADRKYFAFEWGSNQKNFRIIELDSYKSPYEDQCLDTIPEFDWINFN